MGTSALGELYAEYESKVCHSARSVVILNPAFPQVWAHMKGRKRFDMSPDELSKQIPSVKELDPPTLKELWIQATLCPRTVTIVIPTPVFRTHLASCGKAFRSMRTFPESECQRHESPES